MDNFEKDKELVIMQESFRLLSQLDSLSRGRVLAWLCARFEQEITSSNDDNVGNTQPLPSTSTFLPSPSSTSTIAPTLTTGNSLAEVFFAEKPRTAADKVLLVMNWLQVNQQQTKFTAREISIRLKQLGEKLSNITRALHYLETTSPQLIYTKKPDRQTAQAQKLYFLTEAGKQKYQAKPSRVT